MIIEHDEKYPFIGARTMFESPIDSNAFDPKVWDTNGVQDNGSGVFTSAGHEFVGAGVLADDPIFLISGTPALAIATTVFAVPGGNWLQINWQADQDYTNILYKVGEAALHTWSSLLNIFKNRNIAAYTVHWRRAWCDAQFRDFNRDETGDVYCIDPEEEAKLGGKNRVNGALEARIIPP